MQHRAVDFNKRPGCPVAHGVNGLGNGSLAHAGLSRDENVGLGIGGVLHQRPKPLHRAAFKNQAGGGGPGAQFRDFLRVLLNGIPQIAVVALHGTDLLHGDGVEAHRVFQCSAVIKKRDANGCHILMNMVDGLGGGDFFLAADDLCGNTGRKRSVSFQIKGGPADNGVREKSKIAFIGLADPENGAAGIGEHHFICQHQIVLRTNDFEELLERKFRIREIQ